MEASGPIRRYRLLSSTLSDAERRQLYSALPQLLVMLVVVLLSTFFAARSGSGLIMLLIIDGLFVIYIGAVAIPRMRRRLAKCWDTYVLEIGPDYLLRQQADTPDIRLGFSEVKRIEYLPGRYLRVVGNAKRAVIGIPDGLENFPDVVKVLSTICPTEQLHRSRTIRNTVVTAFGFGAYMLMLWLRSPKIVIPLAVILGGFLIWLVIYMQRSPNVSYRSKRLGWLYLVFLIICALKVLSVMATPVR